MTTVREEISTIIEEPSILETSRVSTRRSAQASSIQTPVAEPQQQADTSLANQTVTDLMGPSVNEPQVEMPPEPQFQHFDDPGSIAPPFSVGPDSVGPPSVGIPVSLGLNACGIMSPQQKGRRDRLHMVWIPSALLIVCTLSEPIGGCDQTCTDTLLGGRKEVIDFGDLDLIFKVTSALFDQKSLSAPYLLNQMMDSGQTSYIVMLGWF